MNFCLHQLHGTLLESHNSHKHKHIIETWSQYEISNKNCDRKQMFGTGFIFWSLNYTVMYYTGMNMVVMVTNTISTLSHMKHIVWHELRFYINNTEIIKHTTSKSEFLLIMLSQTPNKIYVTSTLPLNNISHLLKTVISWIKAIPHNNKMIVVVIIWLLDLQLSVQLVPITTTVVSSNGEVSLKQHYVIKFFSDLLQVGGFLQVLPFPPLIKLTITI